jgi:hypothetical protein
MKKRRNKKYKKGCFYCFKIDEKLSNCDNCSAAYHPSCESFKAIYVIEAKKTIVICNECFSLYNDSNKFLKEQPSRHDNCEFQIKTNDLKLKYRFPKISNLEEENEEPIKFGEANEMIQLVKNLFKYYKDENNEKKN